MMVDPIVLTDSTLDNVLYGDKPALILFSNGDGVRGDFAAEFKKVAAANPGMVFAKIDPVANPQAAQRFGIGSKPMMIGFYCGDEIVRRNRPWGTDVPQAVEMLNTAFKERQPETQQAVLEKPVENQPVAIEDHPIKVTDATFEAEVLNSDKPVLVDFWAEWCGPCRMVAPTLEKLAKEFAGQIRVAKVNTDENPGLSQAFRIMSIPTIMCVKNRTIVFSQPGALPEPAFRDLIKQLIALEVPPPKAADQPAQ